MAELAVFGVSFTAMASRCEVVLAAASEQQARQLAEFAIAEVRRIESKYSRYQSDSILSRINAAAGQASVAIDSETAGLLDYADALFTSSAGLFDITSGVLRRAWNFKQQHVPNDETLAPLLALVGWSQVQRSQHEIFLPQVGMEIDFGGFGKEYAADRAASVLLAQGVQHGYVNLGGDLRIFGPMPDGSAWKIGISDPRADNTGTTCASLPVQSGALATSGDYERYIEVGGVRHCHILLPHTGHSVRYWRSVSVLAPLAIAAGSVATIAMLQEAQGLAFLQQSGFAFLAIDCHGHIHQQGQGQNAAMSL